MKVVAEEHFLESYEKHADALFRYALYKTGDRELSKDLLQEALMKTWNYLTGGQNVDNLKAFLYKILNNLIIDHYRKKKADSLDALQEDGFEPEASEGSINLDHLDGGRALALLDKIPKQYKDIIVMRCVQDLSFKEISEITGEPENTVTVRYHRGIEKARLYFNHEEQV